MKEDDVMCWSRYRDANPAPTTPLADDIATAPSGPVLIAMAMCSDFSDS